MQHQEIRSRLARAIVWLLREDELPNEQGYRPYQRETLESILLWLEEGQTSRRAHYTYATGMGKTFVFASLVRAAVGLRSLIVVPSKVLVEQTVSMLSPLVGGMIGHISSVPKIATSSGKILALQGYKYADIVVATDESFIRYWGKLRREYDPHLIIWDECHTAYGDKPQGVLKRFDEAVIIGCSATPDYLSVVEKKEFTPVVQPNGTTLYLHPDRTASRVFGHQLDNRDLHWGIKERFLSPLSWGTLEIAADLSHVPLTRTEAGWDFNSKALYRAMAQRWPEVIQAVLNAYATNSPYPVVGKSAYALCPGIGCALNLADALHQSGIKAACLHAGTSDTARRDILRRYERGDIKFLTSVMVLREGWDAPAAEVCWMLRPTYSYVLYVQAVGRALRVRRDKPEKVALIIDPSFRGTTLSPLNVPALFADPGQTVIPGGLVLAPASM